MTPQAHARTRLSPLRRSLRSRLRGDSRVTTTVTPNYTLLRRPVERGQYTSIDYTQTLTDHGVLASVGSVGDAYDNALAESFVDSFKTELIADRVWKTRSQLELATVEYVGWFNHQRLHSALADTPPSEFEFRYAATLRRTSTTPA